MKPDDLLVPADAARLWISDLASPITLALFVPHSWTNNVLLYGRKRFDPLSRERAALWQEKYPQYAHALGIALAHGPSLPLDRPKFPTALATVLDNAETLAQSSDRFWSDSQTNIRIWKPMTDALWKARSIADNEETLTGDAP